MSGKIETITATDFRRSPGEVLDSVALGKTFIITKNGHPVARLSQHPKPLTFREDVGHESECHP
jgi:antitoxin (DNA-binding transcriptional repressor) of toxin-antitoxin stability system